MKISEFRKLDWVEKNNIVKRELLNYKKVFVDFEGEVFEGFVPEDIYTLMMENPDMGGVHYMKYADDALAGTINHKYIKSISAVYELIRLRRDLKTTLSIRTFDSVVIISSWIEDPERGRAYTSFTYRKEEEVAEEACICMLVADGFLEDDEK